MIEEVRHDLRKGIALSRPSFASLHYGAAAITFLTSSKISVRGVCHIQRTVTFLSSQDHAFPLDMKNFGVSPRMHDVGAKYKKYRQYTLLHVGPLW